MRAVVAAAVADRITLAAAGCAFFTTLALFPAGKRPATRRILPGTVLATLLCLGASGLLSNYVDHVARFGIAYGPLVAVIGLMLWFFFTFYAVLVGAELNAQLERRVASGSAHSCHL